MPLHVHASVGSAGKLVVAAVFGEPGVFSLAWDGETRPCRSGNCAPTSLTHRGAQMDLGPPGLFGTSTRPT